jgi:hypothetical protein
MMANADESARVRVAAGVLVGAQIVAAGGAVAMNLLAAVVLDPSARGDLAFALQLVYFLSVFAIMGLERPFIATRFGGFGDEYRRFARLVLPGTVAILPIAVLATTVAPFSTRWLWAGAIAIGGYVALNSLVHAMRVAYVCSREWKWFALNAIATQVIIVAGALSLVLLGVDDPVIWMWVYVGSTIPAVLILIFSPPHRCLVAGAVPHRCLVAADRGGCVVAADSRRGPRVASPRVDTAAVRVQQLRDAPLRSSAAADAEQLGGTGPLRHRRHCARNGHMAHSAVG